MVVKTIKMAALSAKQRRATMDEVEVLAKLDHPNIVKYHDCFADTATINIVMEYCDAGDLASFIKVGLSCMLNRYFCEAFVLVTGSKYHVCAGCMHVLPGVCTSKSVQQQWITNSLETVHGQLV